MKTRTIILLAIAVALAAITGFSQSHTDSAQALEFTKRVHNFGKISVNEGAKHCSFEFRNISNKPVAINNIISSCGCTTPVWPKKPIMPGETGKVEVTYLNDQGPYPFDKALTVYTSASTKPIVLRITGLAYENEKSLREMFPQQIGMLGVKNSVQRVGQIAQGDKKSNNFRIANTSNKSVSVTFANVSEGLELSIEPQTIAAGEIADISYTVNTAAKENWGSTIYSADVLCNGVKAAKPIEFECMILHNFRNLTKEEKNRSSMVLAQNSSYNFGTADAGTKVTATFNLRNTGYSPLILHKIEHNGKMEIESPTTIAPGEKFALTATIDTNGLKGEEIYTITLVTNSPNRPLVNLFVTGKIE